MTECRRWRRVATPHHGRTTIEEQIMEKPKPYFDIHVSTEDGIVALVIGPPTAGLAMTKLDALQLAQEIIDAANELPDTLYQET